MSGRAKAKGSGEPVHTVSGRSPEGAPMQALLNGAVQTVMELALQAHRIHPMIAASGLMQAAAAHIWHEHPDTAVALLRSYADVLESGARNDPRSKAAEAAFLKHGERMLERINAELSFPTPRGRA